MIYGNDFPTILKDHDLIFGIRLSVFPLVYGNRRCTRSIRLWHVEDLTSWREDVVAFALLSYRPRISLDIWE